jgi:hypothetical protein
LAHREEDPAAVRKCRGGALMKGWRGSGSNELYQGLGVPLNLLKRKER